MIADEAEAAFGVEALAVIGDDARRFLAAVLQRMKPERGQGGRIVMAEDAEHAALLAQPIVCGIVLARLEEPNCRERLAVSSPLPLSSVY